jgi:DNA polymerase-3 subunit alpha
MVKLGWEKSPRHIEALKKELFDIRVARDNNNYDFATYFLIVWDYINYAREQGIVTGCGRGSGYASVLLRSLGITYGPDPLDYGLLWERFLGFDDRQFIKASDFGFDDNFIKKSSLNAIADDLNSDRQVEDDFGGVDRY